MTIQTTRKLTVKHNIIAVTAAAALVLSGCAGGTGDNSGQATSGEQGGYEFGASQEDINTAIADLEPVNLVMQPGSTSPQTISGRSSIKFAEAVEEMSNGQIEIELVWGNAIAAFSELEDALMDGRLDIAQQGNLYFPNEYPVWNDLAVFTQYAPAEPMLGTAVSTAMMADLAWNNDGVIQELESKGLTPLHPMLTIGEWMTACNAPGSEPERWRGAEIRIASGAQTELSQAVGATPVSMEFTEAFEALERGTVDCAWAQASTSTDNGIGEAAPHFSYPTEGSFAGQSGISILAGASFEELPLAYQQIIFDAGISFVDHLIQSVMLASVDVLGRAESSGGGFSAMDAETQRILFDAQEQAATSVEDSGSLGSDIISRAEESAAKWSQVASETGVDDGGAIQEIDEWYEEETSFEPFITQLYEETYLPHRPQ